MTTSNSNRFLGLAALIAERFILSIVFFSLGASELMNGWAIWFHDPHTEANLLKVGNHVVLMMTGFFSSFMLLLARRAAVPPRKLKLVIVPLLTTFFYLSYFYAERLPESLQVNLAPADLRPSLFVVGMIIIVIGHVIAFWGILYLGRSFGVVVAVRKVVFNGPYRWVRHPMYSGWVIFLIGFVITNLSIAYIILVAAHISLLIYRARLEEAELADFSEEYRGYKARTGFIFPKFRRVG